MINNIESARDFLSESDILTHYGKSITDETTFPYGVVNSIISNYSYTLVDLFDNEDKIKRCKKGFEFLKTSKLSPYNEIDIYLIIFGGDILEPKLDTLLSLMVGFVEDLNKKEKMTIVRNSPIKKYWEYSNIKQELTVYECLDRGIPLVGNYIVLDMYDGTRQVGEITQKFIDSEDRLFKPEFNIHHNLMIGFK